MKSGLRHGSSLFVCSVELLLVSGLLWSMSGLSLFGRDTFRVLWREEIRAQALSQREASLRRCSELKREAVGKLIAGQQNLAQTAECFRQAQSLLDDGQDDIVGSYQRVPEEKMDRNVLHWVSTVLANDLPRRQEVLDRLSKESLPLLDPTRPH